MNNNARGIDVASFGKLAQEAADLATRSAEMRAQASQARAEIERVSAKLEKIDLSRVVGEMRHFAHLARQSQAKLA
ncbi:hypothetical protein [Telmatospirillum sp. J64-1]|uniref:hypothetical protein n=1 Tax=Telmatospirillum sp. J64-1 TaxID=2502183 RepID=UPI00115DB2E4|nr:hypothetical protein [Telmatospirillum sp. J64-1]